MLILDDENIKYVITEAYTGTNYIIVHLFIMNGKRKGEIRKDN